MERFFFDRGKGKGVFLSYTFKYNFFFVFSLVSVTRKHGASTFAPIHPKAA